MGIKFEAQNLKLELNDKFICIFLYFLVVALEIYEILFSSRYSAPGTLVYSGV